MSICEHPAPALGLVINCLGLVISQCSVHSNKIEDLRSTPGWTCFATRNCNLWGCKLLGLPSCSLFPIVNVPSRLSSFPSIDPRGGTTHSSRRSTVFQPDVPGDPGRGATVFWVVSTTKASTLRPCKSPWERNERANG